MIDWDSFTQYTLFSNFSDILVILDANISKGCNFTPTWFGGGHGLVQVLSACGSDGITTGPEYHSFTSALIDILTDFIEENKQSSFQVANLGDRLSMKTTQYDIRLWSGHLIVYPENIHLPVLNDAKTPGHSECNFRLETNVASGDDDIGKSSVELKRKASLTDDDGRSYSPSQGPSQFKADCTAEKKFRKASEAYTKPSEQEGSSGDFVRKEVKPLASPSKAVLGEESSFYYDPELVGWTSRKAEASSPVSAPWGSVPFQGHRRSPSETYSDVSSARASPYLGNKETVEFGKFTFGDKQSDPHPHVTSGPGPHIPPQLMLSLSPESLLVRPETAIETAIASRNIQLLQNLLEAHFDKVAVGNYVWIKELDDAHYTKAEIADLLFEEATDSPWIYFEPRPIVTKAAPCDATFHVEGCVHRNLDIRYPDNTIKFGAFLSLEDGELIEEIQELCGLAGIMPTSRDHSDWLGLVNFVEGDSIAEVTYASLEEGFFPTPVLNSAVSTLQRLTHAFHRLQSAGHCCNSCTIIVHQDQPDSVAVRRVDVEMIMDLLERLKTVAPTVFIPTSVIRPSADLARAILNFFLLQDIPSPDPSDNTGLFHIIALAAQCMSLAFLSYNQAHVGPLRLFYLDKPLKRILLLGAYKAQENALRIVVELTELTCIGDMLQSSVLTFSVHYSRKKEAFKTESRKYDLITTAEDLLDTWGPGSFIFPLRSWESPCGIRICGGTIYRVNEKDSLFHWAKDGTQEFPTYSLHLGRAMRIGALVTVNTCCQIDERESWNSSHSAFEYLGVNDEHWKYDESQIGVQAGQYVLLQHNRTRHKIPGKTLKQLLLEQDSHMIVHVLNCLWGVQVSFCTGVTRRVPLRLLMSDLLPVFAATVTMGQNSWDQFNSQHGVLYALQADDAQDRLSALPPDILSQLLGLMRTILVTLQPTGIGPDGNYLMIAWPYDRPPFPCFKIPCNDKTSSWARVLADSGDCATFAYITTSCLETHTIKCRGPLPLWHNTTPLLETAILRHNENPSRPLGPVEHEKTYFFKKMDDMQQVTVERRGAAGTGSTGEVSLYVQSSSIPARFRQRVQRMEILRKRESRIREIREGRETGAELVTVLARGEGVI